MGQWRAQWKEPALKHSPGYAVLKLADPLASPFWGAQEKAVCFDST